MAQSGQVLAGTTKGGGPSPGDPVPFAFSAAGQDSTIFTDPRLEGVTSGTSLDDIDIIILIGGGGLQASDFVELDGDAGTLEVTFTISSSQTVSISGTKPSV